MTIYSEAPYYRLNKWIENSLRGIKELNGSIDSNFSIIPPESQYVTDVDTNDRFADSDSEQEIPFLSPGGTLPELMTIWNNQTKAFAQLPVGTYSILLNKIHDEPWKLCGSVVYTFMFGNIGKLTEMLNFIEALTKREDRSAYDCNWFFRNDSTYPFDMKTINFLNAAGPIAAKDEGGLNVLQVTVGYDAVYEGTGRVGNYGDETSDFMWN
jgi:hypothetical protein